MNKTFFSLLCLLGLTIFGHVSAFAQNGLIVETNDGKTYGYVLAEKPQLTFDETDMIITTATANASFARADIKNFRFEDIQPLSINTYENTQQMSYLSGIVTVEGSETVALFDISGKLILIKKAGNDKRVTIDLNALPHTTYIVRAGKQSLKVVN